MFIWATHFDAPDLGLSENIGVSRSVEMKTEGTKDGFIQDIGGQENQIIYLYQNEGWNKGSL